MAVGRRFKDKTVGQKDFRDPETELDDRRLDYSPTTERRRVWLRTGLVLI